MKHEMKNKIKIMMIMMIILVKIIIKIVIIIVMIKTTNHGEESLCSKILYCCQFLCKSKTNVDKNNKKQ